MAEPLKSHEIAKFAAEGVAIALSARDSEYRGPLHLICGRPPADLFQVDIVLDGEGVLRASKVEQHKG